MSFDTALRASELLLAFALLQQSAEHIFGSKAAQILFAQRAILSVFLLLGAHSSWALMGLSLHSLLILHRFQGPYNGGSDRMGLLVLYCVTLAHWLPDGLYCELAFGYLGVQVILSYFISGQVKIVNPSWRSGQALREVFIFSAYPVSETMRAMADRKTLLAFGSWIVIICEVLFPLSILHPTTLILALGTAGAFHFSNAIFFGLNRFFWFWIASYPSILWLQDRLALLPDAAFLR